MLYTHLKAKKGHFYIVHCHIDFMREGSFQYYKTGYSTQRLFNYVDKLGQQLNIGMHDTGKKRI